MSDMKSIKEKAKEHDRILKNNGNEAIVDCCGRDMFIAGANYALEEIENLIQEKSNKGYLSLFDLTFLIDRLRAE